MLTKTNLINELTAKGLEIVHTTDKTVTYVSRENDVIMAIFNDEGNFLWAVRG